MITVETFQSGRKELRSGYSFFIPEAINQSWTWNDQQINILLEKASVKLGELNSFARLVPNIELFIQLHVTKEAVVSSMIEGTQTRMNEAFLPEEHINPERRDDWMEVQNYSVAMNKSISSSIPISSRLIKQAHKILLQGVRGEHKLPGQFRTSQNWIGGASLADAKFIPPSHDLVNGLMSDLENFLHNENIHVPHLIKIAIIHYQFESIHPFLDGNGRIGRLLITLYLISSGILDKPLFYISAFFEKNRQLYYDNLTNVRERNDILGWLKFFLVGVEQTASQSISTLSEILTLKTSLETLIQNKAGRRGASSIKLLNALFISPITTIKKVQDICSLSPRAANELVQFFVRSNILKEISGKSRYQIFLFKEYLDLFEKI